MNNRHFYLLLIAVIVFFGSTELRAQKTATVNGDIVELTSYIREGMMQTSPAAKEIAIENVKHGGMFAMLEKGTKKLLLIAPKDNDTTFVKTITPFLGVKSFIKGKVFNRSGVRLIIMEDIGKSIK